MKDGAKTLSDELDSVATFKYDKIGAVTGKYYCSPGYSTAAGRRRSLLQQASQCKPCGYGYYCPGGVQTMAKPARFACPDGTNTTVPSASAKAQCIPNFGLCDDGWGNTDIEPQGTGLTCDSPAYPGVSNWFDFDAGTKVLPESAEGDLSKGFVDCCNFWPQNGATQVQTGEDPANFAAVTCSATDGRNYTTDSTSYENLTVVCLRTVDGVYVKYYHPADCCGGMQVFWEYA